MTCEVCAQDKVQSEIEIDHISETAGTFKKLEDAVEYMRHLFMVNFSKMRAVCKSCHAIITHSQRQGISFEDAKIEKEVLAYMKKGTAAIIALAESHGYSKADVSNPEKRRRVLTTILKETS